MKYRKKPVVVEAIRYVGGELDQLPFANEGARWVLTPTVGHQIRTLEGWLPVDSGDWIIKGVAGEFYPCKPDIFEQTYEPVDE